MVHSLSENKFCNRQIVRVSDFEIEVVVEDERNFVAESLDCRDFVGNGILFRVKIVVGILNQFPIENLWRLHCVQLMPINRIDDQKICIRAF